MYTHLNLVETVVCIPLTAPAVPAYFIFQKGLYNIQYVCVFLFFFLIILDIISLFTNYNLSSHILYTSLFVNYLIIVLL